MFTLQAWQQHGVADPLRSHPRPGSNSLGSIAFTHEATPKFSSDCEQSLDAQNGRRMSVQHGMAVRRLTVIECARLQGFPDIYLHVPLKRRKIGAVDARYLRRHGVECWKEKGQWFTKIPADGPMYKAFGNSMATKVMRWIGGRIQKETENGRPR